MPAQRKNLLNLPYLQGIARWETFLAVLILLEIVVFGAINPRFLRPSVLFGSFNDFTSICVISIFVTFVLITGGMDIQSGSIVGLSSIALGVVWAGSGLNIWLVVLLTVITGGLCGAFSGFLAAFTSVPPMVVTLGCSFLYSGFAKTIMKIARIETHKGVNGFPASFTAFTSWNIAGVPFQFIIFVILAVAAHLLLHRTKYGRYVFLCGINRNAADYSGVPSRLVVMSAYIISGMGAAIAGVILTSYLGTAKPDFGKELTLPIITAVVLGGTSILGGKGTIAGTALAAIAIGLMRFGLSMSGLSTQYLDIPVGILLVAALGLRNLGGIKKIFLRKIPAFGRKK
ncbi:MAG: ABC transporter permease [Spirochaetaceae bacterium]|jgi:AI-2 transport system permease protein|nr:ABC transporter permease [Spirochaetaceae bacterium]